MFLKQLNLTNFRNYEALELNFDKRPTILFGNNAAGKSNVLEAVYLLSTAKSQRVQTEDELIKKEEQFAKAEAVIEENGETEILLVILNRPTKELLFKKKVYVNGISRRTIDFLGHMPAVIFYPSDINLITGPPSLRRWHLDLGLAQVDSEYKRSLTFYEQYLTARNKVLKRIRDGLGRKDELTYWTESLIREGAVLGNKRKRFFEFAAGLPESLGDFRFEYIQSEATEEKLIEKSVREIAAAATLIGPHRDDFNIYLGDRNIAHYGSRGEQRTATLAFKLVQLEYMARVLGKRPILLLDDVFSELDARHRAQISEVVSRQQTVIATVELENIPEEFLNSARILKVEDGQYVSIFKTRR